MRPAAIVALTHDPKLDDVALAAALRSPAYYIAALGSRKNHANRLERLRVTGLQRRRRGAHPRPGGAGHRRRRSGRDRAEHCG